MPKTLAVVAHGLGAGHREMEGVIRAVREIYGPDTEICDPDLPRGRIVSLARATAIVSQILARIDQCVGAPKTPGAFDRIVLVGHSIGATLVRRAFLVAAGNPKNFHPEPGLKDEPPRPWAPLVERLILLAAFNRGWTISDRMSWFYSIGFNVAGIIGHVVPYLTPTIFDFRLGAPFMVQTRLHWMAYRRARREELLRGMNVHRPILIQIIGTRDDLVSPVDQVDIAVDGTGRAFVAGDRRQVVKAGGHNDENRDYFLLEAPFTDHDNAIVLYGDDAANERRRLFTVAATGDRSDIHAEAVEPALLTDAVPLVDRTVDQVVFVIHGIRDDGFWTHRVAERIRRAADREEQTVEFRSWTPTYGYFAMLPFMLPWIRRQKVEWFTDQYVSAFAQYPKADFHYIGHSNGTYLGARALEDYPALHLKHVLFAGSVVKTHFPWRQMIAAGRVQVFQNLVGSADWVVALLPKSVDWWKLDLGGAGFDGFVDAGKDPALHELQFVKGSHGAGIVEAHWGQIAEFILHGTPFQKETGARAALYADTHPRLLAFVSRTRLVMPLLIALFGLAIPASILCLHVEWGWSFAWTTGRLLALVVYLALLRFVVTRF